MNKLDRSFKTFVNQKRDRYKKNISFVFIAISVGIIFSVLLFLGFILLSSGMMATLAVFTIIAILPMIKRIRTSKFNFDIHPALLLFCIMPTSFSLIMIYEGISWIEFPLRLALAYTYSLIFLSLTIILPLAIYSKYSKNFGSSSYSPFVSIIIPCYNEEKVLKRTVDNVLKNHYKNKEIIIVDNGSNDQSPIILKNYKNKIRFFCEPKKGKSNAINKGIRSSKGDILVIMDADTIIEANSLSNIVRPFENKPSLGAVTGNIKIVNPTNIHTKIQVLEYALASQISKAALASQNAVTIVSGAFGCFRKSAVMKNNLSVFSNDTLTEDLDASIGILKRGYTTTFASNAIAYTEAPTSLRDLIKQRTRWYRGLIQGYVKHPELLKKSQFGPFPGLLYFLMFNSSLIIPIVMVCNMILLVPTLVLGYTTMVFEIISLNMLIGGSLFGLSLYLDNGNIRMMRFYPVAFVYLRICDFIFIKVMLEHAFRIETKWGHLRRIGEKVNYQSL